MHFNLGRRRISAQKQQHSAELLCQGQREGGVDVTVQLRVGFIFKCPK